MIIESDLPIETRGVSESHSSSSSPTQPKSNQTKPVSTYRLLVIDDDPGFQRLIQQTLEPGAEVLQEFGFSTEIETLPLIGTDLVILDYQMPGKNGLEWLEKIRNLYPELPILFMTGFGDLSIAEEAIRLGASEYIPKPFHPNALRAAVSRWLPDFDATVSRPTDQHLGLSAQSILTEAENYLVAVNRDGSQFRGRVVRFNARAVVAELPLNVDLQQGDELREAVVTLGTRSMEVANARVQSISTLVDRFLVEIGLTGIWRVESHEEKPSPDHIAQKHTEPDVHNYSRFSEGLVERDRIPPEYRAPVLELASVLQEIADDLELLQSVRDSEADLDRLQFEEDLVGDAKAKFFPAISEAIERFEWAADEAGKVGLRKEFERFAQKGLYPHLLCSPFFSRIVEKPIGVPGDYDMLGQMLGNRFQGHTLFARILNGWVLHSHPAKAYRHRISLLKSKIREAIDWADKDGEQARILSVGSGVAYEVQQFVQECGSKAEVLFELEDFSKETLEEALRQFSECQREADPEGVHVQFRQSSVVELATQARTSKAIPEDRRQYHLVYCAGLFDYLSDRMCRNVINYLNDLVLPGGELVISNFTPLNPLRNLMGYVLDWELIYRTVEEFRSLMEKTQAKENYKIVTDQTGTELYAIIKKSKKL